MGSSMTLSDLALSDLERSKSSSFTFQSLVSHEGAQLGFMLPLNINRKPYMGTPMIPAHLTLKGQSQCHSGFE